MSSPAIPAPGFREYTKKTRPHLQTEALEICSYIRSQGTPVKMQAECLLVALADGVDSTHGQFFGAWDNFIEKHRYTSSVVFDWLKRLEDLGLVEKLGYLPGRKTTTFQILPYLYRLDCENPETRPLVSGDQETSRNGSGGADDSGNPDTTTPRTRRLLVSGSDAPLDSGNPDTNTRTPTNTELEHPGASEKEEEEEEKDPMGTMTLEEEDTEKRRQIAALKKLADDPGPDPDDTSPDP